MTAPVATAGPSAADSSGLLSAVALARRNLIRVVRLPSVLVPSIVFPVFQTIAFSGAFVAITRIPGFPTHNILSWFVPLGVMQGAAFGGAGMGLGAITDLETGFFDRLLASPVPRGSLVLGPLFAAVVRALFPIIVPIVIGLVGGLAVPGGLLGLLMLVLVAELVAVTYAAWSLGIAFRVRTQAAFGPIQASIMFVFFLSAAQVPLGVMHGWLHAVARVNPMTNVLRMARQGFLGHVGWSDSWPGLLVLGVALTGASWWAVRGLRKLVP